MKKLRIGIVGGGPGGLTLARVLHRHGIEATVFEREESWAARPQGGSLDLHAESGQFAIECAGLKQEFQAIARYEDQETRVYDKHGVLRFVQEEVTGKNRPEVDRGHLRQMLLESLPHGMVRWGHELDAAVPQADGNVELIFKNGIRERFDLVVGADGAWSRIRPLVSEVRPDYSGILFVELGIEDADRRHPEAARTVGRGLMFAVGESKAILGHRDANAHLGIYAALRIAEDWGKDEAMNSLTSETFKDALASYFTGWSDKLLQLIHSACQAGEKIAPRPIHALPAGHRWAHRQGITLLGDAAHLMSPFGGDGANLAMQDGAALALALATSDDPDAAVRAFEEEMFARAEPAAAGAWDAIQQVFSEEGLDRLLQQMEAHGG